MDQAQNLLARIPANNIPIYVSTKYQYKSLKVFFNKMKVWDGI